MLVRTFLNAILILASFAAIPGELRSETASSQTLVVHRRFWNQTLNDFANASVATNMAAMAAVDGDLIRSARLLAYAQKFAVSIAAAERDRLPSDWRDRAGTHLSKASVALGAAADAPAAKSAT